MFFTIKQKLLKMQSLLEKAEIPNDKPKPQAEKGESLREPAMQSFQSFLLERDQKPRQGKYQRPNVLNAFELENPSFTSAGRGFPRYGGDHSPSPSHHYHGDDRVTSHTQGDTMLPWQQQGESHISFSSEYRHLIFELLYKFSNPSQ